MHDRINKLRTGEPLKTKQNTTEVNIGLTNKERIWFKADINTILSSVR